MFKYRQLKLNLKDPEDAAVRRGVLSGRKEPEQLVWMSNDKLRPDKRRRCLRPLLRPRDVAAEVAAQARRCADEPRGRAAACGTPLTLRGPPSLRARTVRIRWTSVVLAG